MIKAINNQDQWNQFLLELNPNTFLQSWEWGQVQQADGEDVRYLGIFENDRQIGATLVIDVNARRGRHLFIPHGPILAPRSFSEVGFKTVVLREIIEYLKRSEVCALRIAPLLESTPENVQTFRNLGFRDAPMHVHAELTWALDINKSEDQLLAGMRKTTRHAIKKAEDANVQVEITTDPGALDRFYPLYEQTKSRHDFVPYSRNMLETQLNHMNAYTAIATHKGQDLAAAIFFQFGTTVFYYHGASTKTPVPAAQLLQWESIKQAKRRGASLYNFWGIAPDDKPDHPFAGITVFKKGFGGRAIDYMHAQDLPLSPVYWKLWAIDSYRKFKRGF